MEPRISGAQADKVIRKTNYPHSHRIEASGFSEGIWLLWKEDVTLRILQNHKKIMHVLIEAQAGANPYFLLLSTAVLILAHEKVCGRNSLGYR